MYRDHASLQLKNVLPLKRHIDLRGMVQVCKMNEIIRCITGSSVYNLHVEEDTPGAEASNDYSCTFPETSELLM